MRDLIDVSDDDLREELERRSGAPICFYCGKVARFFCDEVVHPEVGLLTLKNLRTCDRPLCEEHRIKCGVSFDEYGPGSVESIDRCPDCEKRRNEKKPPRGGPHGGQRVKVRRAA